MSDIKSYQRLLAVQAIYESTINEKGMDISFDELIYPITIINAIDIYPENQFHLAFPFQIVALH